MIFRMKSVTLAFPVFIQGNFQTRSKTVKYQTNFTQNISICKPEDWVAAGAAVIDSAEMPGLSGRLYLPLHCTGKAKIILVIAWKILYTNTAGCID